MTIAEDPVKLIGAMARPLTFTPTDFSKNAFCEFRGYALCIKISETTRQSGSLDFFLF